MVNIKQNKNSYFAIFLILFLAVMSFFSPVFLSTQVTKLIYYSVAVLLFILAVALKKRPSHEFYKGFDRSFNLLFCGYCSSILVAILVEQQSFLVSCMVMIPYFSYFLYYLFKKYELTIELIERILITISIIYVIVIILNLATYPFIIFGEAEIDLNRGGIRNRVPGVEYAVFALLYFINRFLLTNARKYILYSGVYFIFICLSLTRQTIALSALLGMLFLFNKISLGRKVFFVIVSFLIFKYMIPQIPMVHNMIKLTEYQTEKNESLDQDDIRIQGYTYYLIDGQEDFLRFFFGHGRASYGNSAFGNREERRAEDTLIFDTDVGLASFLHLFGLIAWVGLMSMIVKGIIINKRAEIQYITYFLLYILLSSLASGAILYMASIAIITAALYIIACDNSKTKKVYTPSRRYNLQ